MTWNQSVNINGIIIRYLLISMKYTNAFAQMDKKHQRELVVADATAAEAAAEGAAAGRGGRKSDEATCDKPGIQQKAASRCA
jgi:hypothetical protein